MSNVANRKEVQEIRIGEASAQQPLSGKTHVDETFAVNGIGRGGYVREEKTDKSN